MSFAEIVLRLGVAFVSWIIIYLNFIALLVVKIAECPGGDVAPWTMSFATGLLTIGAALTLPYGHALKGAAAVRFIAVPLLVLLPFALWVILPYLAGTTIDAQVVCDVSKAMSSGNEAAGWQRAWAPLQLAAVIAVAVNGWRIWRQPA
ncbi:MAG: hypothetical protein KJO54_00940 [Gammaproteobacteria bacterium]|nr:hypothetical protein [Gammaproteobacteria bacterium]NNF61751.1 hypothetical protein [Gammaproteobacteria bacterium]NNM21517.1 hypothetical protein [Gammaproteobacteria bacterium]